MVRKTSPWRHAKIATGEKTKRDLSAIKAAIAPYLAKPIYDVEISIHTGILTCEIKMALLEMEKEGTARRAPYGYWVEVDKKSVLGETDRWQPHHFGDLPHVADGDQLTIFYESKEPPEPDDYSKLQEFEEAYALWEINSNYSTSAQELGQGFQQPQLKSENLTSEDFAKSTKDTETSCDRVSHMQSYLRISETTGSGDSVTSKTPTSSQLLHHANPSQSKEEEEQPQTRETVSQKSSERSPSINPGTSSLKMSPDSLAQDTRQNQGGITWTGYYNKSMKAGLMLNGSVLAQDTLAAPSKDSTSFWLDSPNALSSPGGKRPPGMSRLENQLKKLGILKTGEALNPEVLEALYSLPLGWTDPSEYLPAVDLLEQEEQRLETPSTQRSPQLVYEESSTSTRCYRRKGQGSGALLWRTTNKTRKNPTEQLYFEWELGEVRGCTYVRSHLTNLIVRLNQEKRPVIEILAYLDYNPKVKEVLNDLCN
jgi:hypothetical protein